MTTRCFVNGDADRSVSANAHSRQCCL